MTYFHADGTPKAGDQELTSRFPKERVLSRSAPKILLPEAGIPSVDAVYSKLSGVLQGRDAAIADLGAPTV